MNPLFMLIVWLGDILFWVILASVVFSWLAAFNVVNLRHPMIARVYNALNSFTERLYTPIRKAIPTIYGGMDISPVVVLIAIQLIQYTLFWLSARFGI